MSHFILFIASIFVLAMVVTCEGQRKTDRPFGTYSSATDYYNASQFEKKSAKRILIIYTQKPSEKLVGNECVSSFTRELGFEYTYPFDTPGEPQNKLRIFFSNLWNTVRLTTRNGFGWKKKVNERIDQCKLSSGEKLD